MCLKRRRCFCSLALALCSGAVQAHSPLTAEGGELWAAVSAASVLLLFWLLYLIGIWRRTPRRLQIVSFHTAMLLSLLAVLGPLDTWAETSTAWHMVQHMLFLVVIAPLWVISRPLPQLTAGGGRLVAILARPVLRGTRHPMLVAYGHAFVIWVWHVPAFYMLALEDPWWHLFEHLSFLLSAGLLWWVVLRSSRARMGWAMAALLFTLMATGFLGAVLTFASTPLYGDARNLQDQQLAGLIMWVPGSLPYFLAAAWAGLRWTAQMQRRLDSQAHNAAPD